jgi:predicted Holliday junction resolvase-like endonuclease
LPGFPEGLKGSEARFIVNAVDFLVFKGMDEENITQLAFVEVKTGTSLLNNNQKQVRQAIAEKRVSRHECNLKLPMVLDASPDTSIQRLTDIIG